MKQRVPRFLTPEEVAAIFKAAEKSERDLFLLKCLYFLGLRNSEAERLQKDDIDFGKNTVTVAATTSTERKRTIPLPAELAAELRQWLNGKTGSVFAGRKQAMLSDRHIRRIIKSYACQANVRKCEEIHPHTLRHSYAFHLHESGVPLTALQHLLGHRRRENTTLYTRAALHRMKEQLEKYIEK